MSRNAFPSIERALNESQALREHAAAERPMFNFHSHHTFHDDKPEERADRFTPTQLGDLDCAGRPLRAGT